MIDVATTDTNLLSITLISSGLLGLLCLALWENRRKLLSLFDCDKNSPSKNAYDAPAWKVIEYVRKTINDSSKDSSYHLTRFILRESAHNGQIKVFGRRQIKNKPYQKNASYHDLPVEVDREYWEKFEISPFATSELYANHAPHTFPPLGKDGQVSGEVGREHYSELHFNMAEIILMVKSYKENKILDMQMKIAKEQRSNQAREKMIKIARGDLT